MAIHAAAAKTTYAVAGEALGGLSRRRLNYRSVTRMRLSLEVAHLVVTRLHRGIGLHYGVAHFGGQFFVFQS